MVTTSTPLRAPARARISSIATYVPPRVLTNADLERLVETSDEWILQRTGIRERHIVDPGVATSDLAAEAALKAIARASLTPADIDFIVVGTTTPDMLFPSVGNIVQNRLGCRRIGSVDVLAACAASAARSEVATPGSTMCRSRMPVR